MSRQIQIRRGTAAEHSTFTGALGEVTMDTTNKTLRVHDGQTAGGVALAKQSEIPAPYTMPENYDFVVETQAPTAQNNYTWYRKYKSGWIEQGGITTSQSITLPIKMVDANYFVQLTGQCRTNNNNIDLLGFRDRTTTGFIVQCNVVNQNSQTSNFSSAVKTWYVYGICAN